MRPIPWILTACCLGAPQAIHAENAVPPPAGSCGGATPCHSSQPEKPPPPPSRQEVLAEGYFKAALAAFRAGQYQNVIRFARDANAERPQARMHALMAQSLLMLGRYGAAANEARAAATLGPIGDWQTLYADFDFRLPPLNRQIQRLAEHVRQRPDDANARFLLGYQQLLLGNSEFGHEQLAIASSLDPADAAAKGLLKQQGVAVRPNTSVARRPTPPPAAQPPEQGPRGWW